MALTKDPGPARSPHPLSEFFRGLAAASKLLAAGEGKSSYNTVSLELEQW
jgi:hypothetical protein